MISAYLADKIVQKVFSGTGFTISATYVSLHTGPPDSSGSNELTAGSEGGSYSRKVCSWDSAMPRTNTTVLTWTNTPFALVRYFGIWDAASGGNFLLGGPLAVPIYLVLGESARFSAGRFRVNALVGFSDYLAPKILGKIFNSTDFTVGAVYPSLHFGDPGGTGLNEEQPFDNAGPRAGPIVVWGSFGTPTLSGETWTSTFSGGATPGWSEMAAGTYTHGGFWDADSGGNFLWGGAFSAPYVHSTGAADIVAPLMAVQLNG